eukprot:TRINITY_DN30041_c0_g1_i1.p1 TRINITY_DN30041_c0_g1~~TRINITY_DN30041_c0_g1_i1.p1  ORF type:complete len:539 (-),score=45.64 TRINITY_DN30041_c0_g1_i1:358-1974(-)
MAAPIKFQGVSVTMQLDSAAAESRDDISDRAKSLSCGKLGRSTRQVLERVEAKLDAQALMIDHLLELVSNRRAPVPCGLQMQTSCPGPPCVGSSETSRAEPAYVSGSEPRRSSYQQAVTKAETDHTKEEATRLASRSGSLDSSERSAKAGSGNLASRIASAWQFVSFFAVVVFLDAILIAVQVDYNASHPNSDNARYFEYVQYTFVALFVAELVVRVAAERLAFFTSSYWNVLDLLLVLVSLLEITLSNTVGDYSHDPIGRTSSQIEHVRVFRILRLARLAQIVRVTRVLSVLRALRTLVFSIAMTVKSLLWSLVLISLILFFFGVVFTETVSLYVRSANDELGSLQHAAFLRYHFGSLLQSMRTLFACALGGISWFEIAGALESVSSPIRAVFEAYISFFCLAVLNVLTGVFCQSAIESALLDKDMLVDRLRQNKDFYADALIKLLGTMDEDNDGGINILEFEKHFDDVAVKNLYEALGLDPRDAWSLFSLLDTDGNRRVDPDEFVEGCLRLRGHATRIEMESLRKEIMQLKHCLPT